MVSIGVFVCLVLLWYSLGEQDALLWSREGADAYDEGIRKNEHTILMGVRSSAVAATVFAIFASTWALFAVAGAALCFSYIHNGSYYTSRNRIADEDSRVRPYPDGWKSEPPEDSTAKINLSYKTRTILFTIGIGLLIIGLALEKFVK